MRFGKLKNIILPVVLSVLAVHGTDLQTVIANINNNMNKILNFKADFTLQEKKGQSCSPRSVKYSYTKATTRDTLVYSLGDPADSMTYSSVMGTHGKTFPNYHEALKLEVLSDTFANGWINKSLPIFTAVVDSENNDSIYIHHQNLSVVFNYTVDKKRWLLSRILGTYIADFDVRYTWDSANGIFFPKAIQIINDSLCGDVCPFSNIVLNAPPVEVRNVPHGKNPGAMIAGRGGDAGFGAGFPAFFTAAGRKVPAKNVCYVLTANGISIANYDPEKWGTLLLLKKEGRQQQVP